MEPLKTGLEWAVEYGFTIIDPDGWRHNDGVSLNDLITEDEFVERIAQCTVKMPLALLKYVGWESLEQETNTAATVAE